MDLSSIVDEYKREVDSGKVRVRNKFIFLELFEVIALECLY